MVAESGVFVQTTLTLDLFGFDPATPQTRSEHSTHVSYPAVYVYYYAYCIHNSQGII